MLYFAESTYKRYLLKQYTKNTAECRKECDKRRERKSCFGFAAILTASRDPSRP